MSSDLNIPGQITMSGVASFATNGLSHPLSTIQTCTQARAPIPWFTIRQQLTIAGVSRQFDPPLRLPLVGLYRGFTAIYVVDSFTFSIAYITKEAFKRTFGPLGSIFAATAVSTPFIAIGEGAMQNRQANNLPYQNRELWRRSLRIQGLIITMQRELFWNLGIFYATPKMTKKLNQRCPDLPPLASEIIAGAATGLLVGFITTPIAGIKTMVQTSKEELTIWQAVRKITSPQTPAPRGSLVRSIIFLQKSWSGKPQRASLRLARAVAKLFAGAVSRVLYISLTMCVTNVVYERLPAYLPDSLKKRD